MEKRSEKNATKNSPEKKSKLFFEE